MKEFEEWFRKAEDDFSTAKFNLVGKKISAGLFFLQQSAEKALKALYIKKNKSLIRIHDLVALARYVKAPREIVMGCEVLNPFYQQTRYPDTSFSLNPDDSYDSFIKSVEEIILWVKKQLK